MSVRGDDVEIGEVWKEYRREQQQRRSDRLGPRTEAILALAEKGFDVQQMTDYHFRIDGVLDLYPIHQRYHHLPTQRRGGYQHPLDVAIRFLQRGEQA